MDADDDDTGARGSVIMMILVLMSRLNISSFRYIKAPNCFAAAGLPEFNIYHS